MNIKKIKFKKQILFWVIVGIIISIVLLGIIISLSKTKESEILVIYHWWTSPGEHAAICALINVFTENYPEIIIMPTSVISTSSAGGKNVLFDIIDQLILKKKAPDTFQGLAGYGVREYYDADFLEPIDNIWESEELEKVIPKLVQLMCKFDGKYYSIPIGVHRTNVVWYNKKILDENNINAEDLISWEEFFNACDKLKNAGVKYPVQIGTAWTAAHAFDQIIASQGLDLYEDWINGNFNSDDPRLVKSFEIFKKYLSYANPDSADVSWDIAIARIINNEGVFNIMGDWAQGEFKTAGLIYNENYGTFAVPGTKKMYGLVIDTFHRPRYVEHPKNSEKWLKIIGSKEGQDAFNPLKGSISARKDADISKYDAYQQSAIFDFIIIKEMFPAISNGAPKNFELEEQRIISQFIKELDVDKAAKDITDYTKEISKEYTIEWELD